LEIAMMTEHGYPRAYSAAVTAASAVFGPIIPPSITVVIYALVAQNVSVTALLMAGFVPGFIIAIALMVLNYFIAIKKGYPAAARASLRNCSSRSGTLCCLC
jgi:TRAP-type C4-dicarboxylate transport system permease large subunit